MSVAPDYVAPVVGWRTWAAVEDKSGLALRSILFESRWPPRERLVATCRHQPGSRLLARLQRLESHEAPDESCECGIYAGCAPDLALPYLGRLGLVRRGQVRAHRAGRPVGAAHRLRARLAGHVRLPDAALPSARLTA